MQVQDAVKKAQKRVGLSAKAAGLIGPVAA